jgi:cardiolipin synthase (CMP-forming)
LFIVGIAGIIVDRGVPLWFCWLAVAREVVLGGTIAALTLFKGMKRFDVTWWGKTATFMLMFAFPSILLGASDSPVRRPFEIAGWVVGVPGLILSYYVAIAYIPTIARHLRAGDTAKHG